MTIRNRSRLNPRLSGTLFKLLLSLFCISASLSAYAQDPEAGLINESYLIAQVLELKPGMAVADVGAGDGRFAGFMAGRVGNNGKVYATEIDEGMVDSLRKLAESKGNMTVILGMEDNTGLPQSCCDRILLRRVYHHMHNPQAMLKSLLASLKPGGELLIIDFIPRENHEREDATPDDHHHGTSVAHLIETVEKSGFELIRQVDPWPSRVVNDERIDYAVLFRRPN